MTSYVTVASEAQLLQTDKADVHTELKSSEITAMPLNRFRNYQALMNLVPGTTPMAFGNAETDTPARSLATNVNGQVNTNNSTRTGFCESFRKTPTKQRRLTHFLALTCSFVAPKIISARIAFHSRAV